MEYGTRNTVLRKPALSDIINVDDFNANIDYIDGIISKSNLIAITDPTVNDDSTDGYSTGSMWFNNANSVWWHCSSALEGVAQWIHTTSWIVGTVDPTTEGSVGDMYYNTTNYKLFGPKTITWPAGVVLKGADGTNGIDGTNGTNGTNGINGTPLANIIWEGAYNAGTTYSAGDGCTTEDHAWVSIADDNTNHTPPNVAWWVEVGGAGSAGLAGPYTILHDGGANQTIVTTPALCEIERIFMVCDEASVTRTVTVGWAADPDALMTDSEVPHTLNDAMSINNPVADPFTSATEIVATVGGFGGTGVWRIWLKFVEYT